MNTTELKKALTALDVEIPKGAKKADLEALYAENHTDPKEALKALTNDELATIAIEKLEELGLDFSAGDAFDAWVLVSYLTDERPSWKASAVTASKKALGLNEEASKGPGAARSAARRALLGKDHKLIQDTVNPGIGRRRNGEPDPTSAGSTAETPEPTTNAPKKAKKAKTGPKRDKVDA